jgi:putative nucleotidyltransferase with HDIG domain
MSIVAEKLLNAEEAPTEKVANSDSPAGVIAIPSKLCNLPPMSGTASRVLVLTSDPDVDLKDLAHVMEIDPAFAGDILFLANSWLFGFPSKVLSLRHAISLLGLERIKALAVTASMRTFLGKAGPLLRQCWRHSAACAIIAEEIAPIFKTPANAAYTLGLLHDVGRIAMLKAYPTECSNVLKKSFNNADEARLAEREAMTVDHCTAGAWLAKTWRLPEEFNQVCAKHHDPVSPNDPGYLQVAKTACCVADALGFPALNYSQAPVHDEIAPHFRRDMFPGGAELKANVEARLLTFD